MRRPSSTGTSPSARSSAPWESTPASPTSTNFTTRSNAPYLTFPALSALPFLRHAFTVRAPVPSGANRESVSPRSLPHTGVPIDRSQLVRYQEEVLHEIGTSRVALVTANQVHGNRVAVVTDRPRLPIPDTDGLITRVAGLPLSVYVADCCAVFLVDQKTTAIGLLHSGKKGTLANIAGKAINAMRGEFQTDPSDVLAVLSPCIGPCHYEMDIPSAIERQLCATGVRAVIHPRICTACNVGQFYSYRAEKGQTGRMLATLVMTPGSC